jgi:hypothetical protein
MNEKEDLPIDVDQFEMFEKHRCWFGSSGRCPCGLHRTPERAIGFMPLSSNEERLAIEL